jgi:hypothetical protein
MQLQDYFNNQKEHHVSQAQKFSIYKKIIEKKAEKNHFRRKSFLHIKSFAYGLTLTVLFVSIYGTFFLPENINIGDTGFLIQPKIIKGVDADYIANIVNFEGEFSIENKGNKIQSSNIHNGDTVILAEDTDIIFHMNENTQAKVTGPARFVLNKNDDGYRLELSYGDFVEIQSLQEENQENIEIQTDGILVSQPKATKAINFQLISQ